MSATVILIIIMLNIFQFHTIFALENRDLTKLVKHHNEDITLHCSLTKLHEDFNKNTTVTNVSWLFLETCKVCTNELHFEDWKVLECDGTCTISLTLDDNNASSGFYRCKISPYAIDAHTTLQIEITKTFQLEVINHVLIPPPEIFNDTTQSKLKVDLNSQIVLQCKCKSIQKPTIKWFKQKDIVGDEEDDEHGLHSNMENPRAIKYFEKYYQPVASATTGIKELEGNVFLSKLILNNLTYDSTYVCVAINYFGFSYRDFVITVDKIQTLDEEDEDIESNVRHDDKTFELFLIPILLLVFAIIQISTIIYLLIYRSIIKETNKNIV